MLAVILYPLLLVLGLICTFSTIPPTKKLLSLWFHSFHHHHDQKPDQNPTQDHALVEKRSVTEAETTTTKAGLRSVFATFDKNDDGYITRHELRESLKNIGIHAGESDVADMVQRVDANGDGLIDFDEFCELFDSISSESQDRKEEDVDGGDLKEAFDVFDENKDGLITVEELGFVLSSLGFSEGKKMEECKEMIRRVDVDGDGMVNFDEFKRMMKDGFGRLIAVS